MQSQNRLLLTVLVIIFGRDGEFCTLLILLYFAHTCQLFMASSCLYDKTSNHLNSCFLLLSISGVTVFKFDILYSRLVYCCHYISNRWLHKRMDKKEQLSSTFGTFIIFFFPLFNFSSCNLVWSKGHYACSISWAGIVWQSLSLFKSTTDLNSGFSF